MSTTPREQKSHPRINGGETYKKFPDSARKNAYSAAQKAFDYFPFPTSDGETVPLWRHIYDLMKNAPAEQKMRYEFSLAKFLEDLSLRCAFDGFGGSVVTLHDVVSFSGIKPKDGQHVHFMETITGPLEKAMNAAAQTAFSAELESAKKRTPGA